MIRWFYSLKKLENNITKFGIILNPSGPIFGGAQKRFTNLFQFLYFHYPDNVFYFISQELQVQIQEIFPELDFTNVVVLKNPEFNIFSSRGNNSRNIKYNEKLPVDEAANIVSNSEHSLHRQILKYFKNYIKQYYLFRQVDKVRKRYNINVLLGVFNGILPLYFYLNKKKRSTGIIFSDMDSWFSNINNEDKNYWYKK